MPEPIASEPSASQQARRATFSVGYNRSFVPSFGFGGTFQNQDLHGSVRYDLARRLFATTVFNVRQSDPLVDTEDPFHTFRMTTSLSYGLQRWARVEGYYSFTRQDARRAGGLVHRNRVGIQIVTSKPMRLH